MQKRFVVPVVVLMLSGLLVGCPPHPRLELGAHTLHFDIDDTVKTFTLANTCWRSACALDYTIAVEPAAAQAWVVVNPRASTVGPNQQITVTVTIAPAKAVDAFTADLIVTTNGGGSGTVKVTTTPNLFTEVFDGTKEFKLENSTIKYIPTTSRNFYRSVWTPDVFDLPTPTTGAVPLPSFLLGDPIEVMPLAGKQVWLYGQAYNSFFVGSNGRITFEDTVIAGADALAAHMLIPGISALGTQLGYEGTVSAIQLDDRIVVTYEDVPTFGHGAGHENTFQVELFFDDAGAAKGVAQEIDITWLNLDDDLALGKARHGLVIGLGQGYAILLQANLIPLDEEGKPIPLGQILQDPILENEFYQNLKNLGYVMSDTTSGTPDPDDPIGPNTKSLKAAL